MPKRTTKEQKAAEEFHREKCCTTKWMCWGIVLLFIGLVLLIAAVGIYNAWDLSNWKGAQYRNDCYVRAQAVPCNTETCTDRNSCSVNTYYVTPTDDSTCAAGECPEWNNGCAVITFTTECDQQHEFYTGDLVDCYAFAEPEQANGEPVCRDAGRLDPNGDWLGQRTTYVVLLVFAIIFIVVSIVFFIIGGIRCVCKKVDDDVLGETNGTGCYWCMDYDRCCYGEGTGHATIVNEQGKNLPVKDKKRRKKSKDGEGGRTETKNKKKKKRDYDEEEDEEEYDQENAGLR